MARQDAEGAGGEVPVDYEGLYLCDLLGIILAQLAELSWVDAHELWGWHSGKAVAEWAHSHKEPKDGK